MAKYQLLFIIDKDVADEEKEAIVQRFSDLIATLGGSVQNVDKWGIKKYAYEINRKTEGYYVLIEFEAGADVPAEIDRQMRNSDAIVRQMITLA